MKNLIFISLYGFVVWPLALSIFYLLSFFNPKIREGLRLRRSRPWRQNPFSQSQVIWFHCASGEFEYAKPVIRKIKQRWPQFKIVLTFFSPSVRESASRFAGVDLAFPAPWDSPRAINEFLQAFQPRLLLISRTDLWPQMLFQCRKKNIPSLLFSATLTRSSGRMNPWTRFYFSWLTSLLTEIFCVSEADRQTFLQLNPGLRVQIKGDTRYEQVLERLRKPQSVRDEIRGEGPILIAGSTWPEDEAILLPMLAQTRIRSVLVPHEPTLSHIHELQKNLRELQVKHQLYSGAENAEWDVLVVDQTGILAELYQWGNLAFVGGSFRKTVHSVMEPLAAGCLTVVGPCHLNNREAIEFQNIYLQDGDTSLVCVAQDTADFVQLVQQLLPLSQNPQVRQQIQARIQERGNATTSVMQWVEQKLP